MTCGDISCAKILSPAPQFTGKALVNGDFKDLSLQDFKGKYLVLVFYPLDFTFVCPTEIIAFNDRIKEFRELNADVVACSVDSHYSHLAWSKQPRNEGGLGKLDIALLSDLKKCISKNFGVLLESGHSTRGTFIIDPEGIIRHITINEPGVGRSVDETLRLLKAIQFHAKNGEVCPINWVPGSKTIVPDPLKAKEFFAKSSN